MEQNQLEEKISIIIPVYNVEIYLRKCLDSICSQTYKNIEMIVVDDGSTDGSAAICDEYAQKDSRIKVIHKLNGGLSSARNAGLDVAKGEYILFVDSDDYIEREMVQRLYEALKSTGADMSLCNYRKVNSNKKNQFEASRDISDQCMDEAVYWHKLYETDGTGYVVAWNKLYRRQLWENLRYPEGKINEDEYVLHEILSQCQTITGCSFVGYNYLERDGSIMSYRRKKANFDVFDAWLRRIAYFKKNAMYQEMQIQLSEYCLELIIRCHTCKTSEEKKKYREYTKRYKELYRMAACKVKMPLKEKLKTFGSVTMPEVMYAMILVLYGNKGIK